MATTVKTNVSVEVEEKAEAKVEEPKAKTAKRNSKLAKRCEDAAAKFLYSRGYEILERNWKCYAGEIDIIAMDGNCLVFVYVKTRDGSSKGFPSDSVSKKKREEAENIALAYLKDFDRVDIPIRFDIMSLVVLAPDRAMIRHTISAFSM